MCTIRSPGALFVAVILAGYGCTDQGPVIDPGEIDLSLNSLNNSDFIQPGVLEKDENIGQGSANPWGDFIAEAVQFCGGEPVGFAPTAATIRLDAATSTNIADLESLASGAGGAITMHFLDTTGNDANATRVNIARITNPTGVGPVQMSVIADRNDMNLLLAPLVGGDFHVGVRVQTALASSDDFSANLRMSLGMRAFCS